MANARAAAKKKKKVVVMGGGTGTFTVLSGLKKYPFDLTAIVAMSDDGGSTGRLRDELGVLPPGDVRQCLVALSASDRLMRTLMGYRFAEGGLKGHSFGNLLLSALEKITGSFDKAVEKASEILRIRGRVVPATLDKVALEAKVGNRTVRGEDALHHMALNGKLKNLRLRPRGRANPKALQAIREADAIVIGPGDFYSSLLPNLLVHGIPEAVRKSRAEKIYVCNLMTKVEHTKGFGVREFAAAIEQYLGGPVDKVIYNAKAPGATLLKRYARQGDEVVAFDRALPASRFVGADLVSKKIPSVQKGDALMRTLIRHDPDRLARVIASLVPSLARRRAKRRIGV